MECRADVFWTEGRLLEVALFLYVIAFVAWRMQVVPKIKQFLKPKSEVSQ